MNPRERLISILKGEQPDQVPWFGDLDYWTNSLIKRGLKPADFILSGDYIKWHRDLGVGFYLQGYFPYKQTISNCDIRDWYEGHRHYKEIKTPLGSVRECWEFIPTSFSDAPVGFTVLEALTPHPVGDMKWEELESFAGDSKSILWGGIPGSYFTDCVDDEEFDRHVKYLLEIMRQKPRYVLGVADQVPPDGLERRVKRVSELVSKFGKY
jgi:hypothetical protein